MILGRGASAVVDVTATGPGRSFDRRRAAVGKAVDPAPSAATHLPRRPCKGLVSAR